MLPGGPAAVHAHSANSGAPQDARNIGPQDGARPWTGARPILAPRCPNPEVADRMNAPPPSPTRAAWIPLALLAVALAASSVLALDHLEVLRAPGCGVDGACARAAQSALGRVPLLGWPTAFVGAAYFAALLAGALRAGGRIEGAFRLAHTVGVLASIVLLAALFVQGTPCPWCLAVHAANLGAWWSVRRAPSGVASARSPWPAFLLVFATTTLGLALVQRSSAASARERAEAELAHTTAELRAAPSEGAKAFTARWCKGPQRARARVVVFTDYQCPDCRRVEEELERYAAAHADVSLAVKHFPMCPQCNRHAPDLHPNACWAARAAIAAGMLGGEDGFWRMHAWLFARSGSFTKSELETALPGLGFETAAFTRALNAPESLAAVTADVEEAMALGLARTPLVFVNGVELRGWDADGAVARALDAVRTPAADAAADAPPPAREKVLGDWRAEPKRTLPPDRFPRALGRADAPVSIVLFGDYQDEFTVRADAAIRTLALGRDDVRYDFRHFPANQACNPGLERTLHPLACLAAMGAEAAAQIQESNGFWTMHDWLMEHRTDFDDAVLVEHAKVLGMERELFWEVLQSKEVTDAIYDDVLAAKELDVASIPAIWVGGKFLARWQVDGVSVLPEVVEEALGEARSAPSAPKAR